jgi:membrane protease YdiL (CAAX protease family)
MGKVQTFQIEASHEGIDEADRVLFTHVVIESLREEGHLIPVHPFDVAHPAAPGGQVGRHDLPYTRPDFSHRLSLQRTRLRSPLNSVSSGSAGRSAGRSDGWDRLDESAMKPVLLMSAEFALALAGLLICALQLLPVPIILLLFIAWGSLRVRHMAWRDVGMRRPEKWLPVVMVASVAAVGYQAIDVFVIIPILQRLTGRPIDLLQLSELRGNVPGLMVWLALTWTLGAFLEEMFFRGYLLNRINDVGGPQATGTSLAVVASALLFGAVHACQGITGIADNVLTGVLLGVLYLVGRRNLWWPILTHGAIDTVGFLLIFTGVYR